MPSLSPDALVDRLLANRIPVMLALLVLTLAAAASATRLQADQSIEAWFLEDDPGLEAYDRFTRQFAADELVMVGLFADNVLTPERLAIVANLARAIEQLEHVHRTQSIIDSPITDRVGGYMDAGFTAAVLASPLLTNSLLTPDGSATAILVHYARSGNTFADKRRFVEQLESLAASLTANSDLHYAITGGAVLNKVSLERNERDMTVLVPIMLLVILAVTWFVFRRLASAILPLLVVTIALLWTFGLMAALGWRFTMISSILVPLILAVGVADAIHVAARYSAQAGSGDSRTQAIRTSFSQLLKPCWLTTATTALGLLSLLVSELQPIREFAITAAFGVLAAFVLSITMLPIALTLPDPPRRPPRHMPGVTLHRIAAASHRHRTGIVLAAIAVATAASWMAARVEVVLDPLSWLPEDSDFRSQTLEVDAAFGGTLAIEFLLTTAPRGFGEPASLRRLDSFQAWLLDNTSIRRAQSVADLVKEGARIARDAGAEGYSLPRTKVITHTILEGMKDEAEFADWLSPDWSTARISARLSLAEARHLVDELPAIEQRIVEEFAGSGIDVAITGQAKLVGDMQHYVVESQIRSFSVAVAVVALLLIVQLRSFRLGLLAMIPNLLPILVGLGGMAMLGIPLNPGTVMIAAVAMGVVVDDSVHVLAAYQRHAQTPDDRLTAIRHAVTDVGRPVVITSLLLAMGFLVLVFGSFEPSRQIGQVVALVVVAALLADLLLLPALLSFLDRPDARAGVAHG
jgi:hydrophobe/amphiphile efflux-3 (HAE3) family protein